MINSSLEVYKHNLTSLLERTRGQHFCVKDGRLTVITGLCQHIKYCIKSTSNRNAVKTVITSLVKSIDKDNAIYEDIPALKKLFYEKLGRLTTRVFDREAITADVEQKLADILRKEEFAKDTDSPLQEALIRVRHAYLLGIDLKLVPEGSSGAYRGKSIRGSTPLVIIKPFDEGPYGINTPKRWTRIIRVIQNCFKCCCWNLTRKSLRPNSEYLSEELASHTSDVLRLNVVPLTRILPTISRAFYRAGPEGILKPGSCQLWQDKMITLASHLKNPKSGVILPGQQLEHAMIQGMVTGNQDDTPENIGLCEERSKDGSEITYRAVAFDNGLSFPQTHPTGYLSTRNQCGLARLDFAKRRFSDASVAIIDAVDPEALIKYLEANVDVHRAQITCVLNEGQKRCLRDRVAVLKKVAAQHLPMSDLAKYKTAAQIHAFLK